MAKAPTEIRSLARAHTESALNVLASIMNQPDAPHSARVQASTALLDRGWGKPTQIVGGDPENPVHTVTRIENHVVDPRGDKDGS